MDLKIAKGGNHKMVHKLYCGHSDQCLREQKDCETVERIASVLVGKAVNYVITNDDKLVAEVVMYLLKANDRLWYERNDLQAHEISLYGIEEAFALEIVQKYLQSEKIARLFITNATEGILTVQNIFFPARDLPKSQ